MVVLVVALLLALFLVVLVFLGGRLARGCDIVAHRWGCGLRPPPFFVCWLGLVGFLGVG